MALSLVPVFAETAPPSPPAASVAITPDVADMTQSRTLDVQGLAASTAYPAVVIDPSGGERQFTLTTSDQGSIKSQLSPPGGTWLDGLYRVALGIGDGRAVSATFVAGDGKPHLSELTVLPSPWSALYFVGTGLPPDQDLQMLVDLTGARETTTIQAHADGNGTLTAYLWPQEINMPFFEAGYYMVEIPSLGLKSRFALRERPGGSIVTMDPQVVPNVPARAHFGGYQPNRMLWGVYASSSGQPVGEFLTPPTDAGGRLDAMITFPQLSPGTYLLATPYDWGETSFTVPVPTPTATPTSTPTPTATPDPPKKSNKKCNTRKKRAKNKACKAKKKTRG